MRRALVILGWTLLGLIVLPLLLAAVLIGMANTRSGQGWIEQATAHFSLQRVQLRGLSGRFPGRLYVAELALRDPQGTWLQADDVAIDWSPWPLLERRVRILSLSAARVTMARRPDYPAGTRGAAPQRSRSGSTFELPLTIQIDRLELPRVQLGAALAGNAVAARLQGGGRYRSIERAALQLTVQRLDQVPATYDVNAQLGPRRLHVALDLAEQANGPIANLAHLSGLGPLAVALRLDGPRDDLTVNLNAHADGLRAFASGTLDLPDRSASLDLNVQAPAMAPRADLSWRSVVLQAHAHGAFTAPTTSARLDVTGLVASTVRVGAVHANLRGEGQGLALQATLAGLALPAPLGTLLQASALQLDGQARIEGLSGVALDLSVAHPLIAAQAHYELGSLRLGPRPHTSVRSIMRALLPFANHRLGVPANTGTLTASFPNLAPWAALAHADLRGRGTLQGSFDLAPSTRLLAFTTEVAISGGEARLTRLLAPRATLSAQLAYDDHSLHLLHAQLAAAHLQASAQGLDDNGQLTLGWQLGLPDLAGLALPATGRLSAQGRMQGRLGAFAVSASADAHFTARTLPADLHLELRATGLPQRPAGQLQVSGTVDRAPVVLLASLQRSGTDLSLAIQRAEWQGTQLQGTLRVAGDWQAPQGELALRVQRLSALSALIGEPLHGRLEGTIHLSGRDGANRADLQLEAHELGVSAQRLSLLQIRGNIGQPFRAPRLALRVTASGMVQSVPAQLQADVEGPLSQLRLQVTARTSDGVPSGADVTLAALWREPRRELELTQLEAHYRQQRARLLKPALLSFEDGIVVDHLNLSVPPAELQLHGRLMPTLDLQASARHLDTAVLGVVMPRLSELKPQGSGSAQIDLHGSWQQPSGSLSFSASGLGSGSGAIRGLPTASVQVQATLAAGLIDLTAAADAGTHMRVRVNGRVPLRNDLPLQLQLMGTVDLNIVNAVLEAGGQRVLGELRIQAQVDGTPQVPQARGELTLMDGSFQDYALGLSLTGIQATLQADGTQVKLTHMSAQAGSGTLTASGSVNLAAHGLPLQLTVNAHNAQPLKSDLLTANLDMGIGVTGTLVPQHLTASGTLHINRATFNIPSALPANVPVLNVVKPGQQAQAPAPTVPLFAEMNIAVNAPTGIFVRGRGLSAEVGGTLHAGGSSSKPSISGGFDLINGTLDMAGSTLTFTNGRLSFNGTGLRHRIDPTLDFTASSSSGGITENLHVGGYADAPLITLTSTPPLPQDEILARLLFGESVAQLTPLQIAGIGAGLVTLTGAGGGGFNPLSTVEHALGLNRLVISSGTPSSAAATAPTGATGPQNSNGATIEAGRYITNRIYVGAKQSTNGLTQAQVQIDLHRNLKLQTTLSSGGGTIQGATPQNDPGSSVGITYQFQY